MDWVDNTDLNMLSEVIGELNNISQFTLFSDRCGVKDIEKMDEEYAKDLKKPHLLRTKNHLHRFLKGSQAKPDESEEKQGDESKQSKDDK